MGDKRYLRRTVDQVKLTENYSAHSEGRQPEKIILSGSAARGEMMGPNSDVDCLW